MEDISRDQALTELAEWARVSADRDSRIRRALAAGMSKKDVHRITGIARSTIDRIAAADEPPLTEIVLVLGGRAPGLYVGGERVGNG